MSPFHPWLGAALVLIAAAAAAQEPAPKMDALDAIAAKYPFPLLPDISAERLKDEYTRQIVAPQGKRPYAFSVILRKGGWKEIPTAVEDIDRAEGAVRLLAAVRDLDPETQTYLTVDFVRLKSIVDPLDYLEQLAGNGGWLVFGRQIYLRQEQDLTYVRVPNLLAQLEVDPKTGQRTMCRAAVRMEGERLFVLTMGVPESRYRETAEEMALAALTFDVEERTSRYPEPLRRVTLRKGAAAAHFEVGESWIVRADVVPEHDVAGVGMELAAGESRLIGAMAVFVYSRKNFPSFDRDRRVKAIQEFVRQAAGVENWKWLEKIDFVASRAHGPTEGRIDIWRGDLAPASGKPVPSALELRIACMRNDDYWAVAWLYAPTQTGDRQAHAVTRRAFSTVMDTLEFD